MACIREKRLLTSSLVCGVGTVRMCPKPHIPSNCLFRRDGVIRRSTFSTHCYSAIQTTFLREHAHTPPPQTVPYPTSYARSVSSGLSLPVILIFERVGLTCSIHRYCDVFVRLSPTPGGQSRALIASLTSALAHNLPCGLSPFSFDPISSSSRPFTIRRSCSNSGPLTCNA